MSGSQNNTMNLPSASTTTVTATIVTDGEAREQPTLRLRCHKPKTRKKVQWTETTVDNEHMDRKKSKCCCVYVKTRKFGESSSESEDECEHCFGHVEMKKKPQQPNDHDSQQPDPNKPGRSSP